MKTREKDDWQKVKKGARWNQEGSMWKRDAKGERVNDRKNAFGAIAEEEDGGEAGKAGTQEGIGDVPRTKDDCAPRARSRAKISVKPQRVESKNWLRQHFTRCECGKDECGDEASAGAQKEAQQVASRGKVIIENDQRAPDFKDDDSDPEEEFDGPELVDSDDGENVTEMATERLSQKQQHRVKLRLDQKRHQAKREAHAISLAQTIDKHPEFGGSVEESRLDTDEAAGRKDQDAETRATPEAKTHKRGSRARKGH